MRKISSKFKITLLLVLAMILINPVLRAQNNQTFDIVTINVICSGKTEMEAISEGLRSALTQTSVVFISSNTTIINDQMAKDEISMINNGSINKYVVLDKFIDEKGTYNLNLEVSISLNKFESFVESSGGETELKGGLFAANIKLMELNEKAEQKAIDDLIEISRSILNNSFDYSITNGEPTNSNGLWQVPLEITISKNKNYSNFTDFFYVSLKNMSMSKPEIEKYGKLKKTIFNIGLFDNSKLTNSTPKIDFLENHNIDSLYSDLNLSYYIHSRIDPWKDQIVPLEDSFTFLTNDRSVAEEFKNNHYEDGNYRKFYTTNSTGNFNSIFLRSETSFNAIEKFIISLENELKNIKINNGFDSINLKDITNYTYSKFKHFEEFSNFLIAIEKDRTHWDVFLHSFNNGIQKNIYGGRKISSFNLREYASNLKDFHAKIVLRNRTWDKKTYFENWKQVINLEEYKIIDEFGYFNLVFGNYLLYLKSLEKCNSDGSIGRSFPLQLTLIGDENNQVFKIGIYNYLTTDEIANVKKYTITK